MIASASKVKTSAMVYSVLFGLLVIGSIAIFTAKEDKQLDIGDFSGYDPIQTEQTYLQAPTNENLLLLLKVLCYESEVEDKNQTALLQQYGTELFSRAKKNEIDLATADDEAIMLKLIKVIKKNGAS